MYDPDDRLRNRMNRQGVSSWICQRTGCACSLRGGGEGKEGEGGRNLETGHFGSWWVGFGVKKGGGGK